MSVQSVHCCVCHQHSMSERCDVCVSTRACVLCARMRALQEREIDGEIKR